MRSNRTAVAGPKNLKGRKQIKDTMNQDNLKFECKIRRLKSIINENINDPQLQCKDIYNPIRDKKHRNS